MVEKVSMYKDSRGGVHKSALDAWKAELANFFVNSTIINPAQAGQLAEWIDFKRTEELQRIIGELREALPGSVSAAA